MGIEIASVHFDDEDRQHFAARLETQLLALGRCLDRPGFGGGEPSIGAELELYIVGEDGYPLHDNESLWQSAADPLLTLELNRYNLEYNLHPFRLAGGGLSSTERQMVEKLEFIAALAAERGARVVPIGILPTLRRADFGVDCITDRPRYHALVEQLRMLRGSDFLIDIGGPEPLQLAMSDMTLEGANTSFQVHLRVAPGEYADTYNAMQLVTPLVLAVSANSPGLFGHQLWEETRIPLFKQSIDTRHTHRQRWHQPARVCFGHGWVRRDALELFRQAVRLYPPLLPACGPGEDGSAGTPELAELRLHQGTVWQWNRPVYDAADGGHLRIEMRALPAGPSPIDMVASAALQLGLAAALRDEMECLVPALPFYLAEYNFYRAAKFGLDTRVVWPHPRQQGPRERGLLEVLEELLPRADDGLATLGVERAERDRYLGVIERRIAARTNGSRWQRRCLQRLLEGGSDKDAALHALLDRYHTLASSGQPVAEWDL